MSASLSSGSIANKPINRREFLNYVWSASIVLLLGEATGGVAWYLSGKYKPIKEIIISLDLAAIPPVGTTPVAHGPKLWLSNMTDGFYAFHDFCTHLGCQIKWVYVNNRFECPCHGAKFEKDGTYISGPAGRSLDRYLVRASTPHGTNVTPSDGGPVNIDGATAIEVDTEVLFAGKPNPNVPYR